MTGQILKNLHRYEAIKNLKNGKSPGIDEITAELIKNDCPTCWGFLSQSLLQNLERKVWPTDWMNSVFVAIPKKGDTMQLEEYWRSIGGVLCRGPRLVESNEAVNDDDDESY